MANQGVVVFLEEYRNCLANLNYRELNAGYFSSNRRDFLESCFAYAVHDFLEDEKETKYHSKKELEEVAKEIHCLDERVKTRELLTELANEKNEFIDEIKPYLMVFYERG